MYTQRNEKIVKKGGSSSTINYSLLTIHSGMTLVELLVAVSIMVLLVAVSIPMFKPMLDSQKTAEGARTVATALQRARIKAMETGQPHGIRFERLAEVNELNVSVRLFLVKPPKPYTGNAGDTVTVNNATGGLTVSSDWSVAGVNSGDFIQFNYQGKYYKLSGTGTTWVARAEDGTYPPTDAVSPLAVPFRIRRGPVGGGSPNLRMALAPSMVMPRSTIVDLQWSGRNITNPPNLLEFDDNTSLDPVVVMFAPNGTVDDVYFGSVLPRSNALIHFCIGEWERGISVGHEDGRNNIQTASNFWVTVNPRTGEVRTAEMNTGPPDPADPSPDPIKTARQFAREHFVNIGGF